MLKSDYLNLFLVLKFIGLTSCVARVVGFKPIVCQPPLNCFSLHVIYRHNMKSFFRVLKSGT